MEPLNQMIEGIRKEQVILFLGAGFSLKAGAPSGRELVKAIKSKMTDAELKDEWNEKRGDEKGEMSLSKVSGVYERLYDRESLLAIIEDAMCFTTNNLEDHRNLPQIPHFHTIITTNYDTLLEDTYGDECYVIRTASDCINKPTDKTYIYKIHGDFQTKEQIILTDDDYTEFFESKRGNSLWAAVKDELLSHDVLFIGYSLDDTNIFKILQEINKDTRGMEHHYYLVAPSLTPSSKKKIEKEGVVYIDGRAEDILPKIIEVLDKKVDSDFKHKRISTDLYNKYCRLHKFIPTTKPSSDGRTNSVSEYEFIEPSMIDVQFTLPKETAIALRDFNFEALPDNLQVKRNSIGVPYCSITKEMMSGFEMTINNMVTMNQEEIKELVITAITHKKSSSVRIPSIGFNEKVEYTLYGVNGGCHVILPTDIFNIDMTICGTMDDSQINITFKEKYKNNSEAIKWIDFLIAFCSGEVIQSTEVLTTYAVKRNEEFVKTLHNMKQYYKNLNEIECKYNITFDEYENFSEDRYRMSVFLLAIYNEGCIDVSHQYSNNPICINTSKTLKQLERMSVKTGDHFALKYSQEVLSPYHLCGHNFCFGNRVTFIYDALITDITETNRGLTKITYTSVGNVYQIYTDRNPDLIIDVDGSQVIPIVA